MKISFENPDKINGLMTLTVENEDFQKDVEKALKDYQKKANVPGFRPGHAPLGMIKRQYGTSVKMDVVNRVVGKNIYDYIRENKINMLGDPLPSSKQTPIDIEHDAPYTFYFDIAVAPELDATLSEADTIDYYHITVDDKLVDQQVEMFRSRAGHYDKVEAYNPEEQDMLKGDLRELDADGNVKEDGITVSDAVMMPKYIKVDEQKALFAEAKLGDIITFNPKKAYPEGTAEISSLLKIEKEQAETITADFTYQVTEISRYVKADINEDLFKQVFGDEENIADEAAFRKKIADGITEQLKNDEDYKFIVDIRAYLEQKNGDVKYPDELMKRIMKGNNPDKDDKFIEDNFAPSLKELTWNLLKNQLGEKLGVKVEQADVKEVAKQAARIQFAQYGMTNVPEDYIDKYADDMVKNEKAVNNLVDRAIEEKLAQALKKVVKLNEKQISLDDFNKMMQG